MKRVKWAAVIIQSHTKRFLKHSREREQLAAAMTIQTYSKGSLAGGETQAEEQGSEGGKDESGESELVGKEVQQSKGEAASHH